MGRGDRLPGNLPIRRAQHHNRLGRVETDGPHHVGLQRLAGLGLVGDDGAQGVDAEVALFELALLVRVDQVAASALQAFRHAVVDRCHAAGGEGEGPHGRRGRGQRAQQEGSGTDRVVQKLTPFYSLVLTNLSRR